MSFDLVGLLAIAAETTQRSGSVCFGIRIDGANDLHPTQPAPYLIEQVSPPDSAFG